MIDLSTRGGRSGTGGRPVQQRAWVAVGLGWLVCVGALIAWLLGTANGALRDQLRFMQFWSLELGLFFVVVAVGHVARNVWQELDRTDLSRMAILASVALGLTVFVAPRTNRIFYDEQIYQSIGQNLADLRLAQVCNEGGVEYGRLKCASGEYNKQPYGYPHVLSVAYRLFGAHANTAFVVNAGAMAFTVCAVYLLTWLLFRDREAAVFAGLILALTPEQIIWSATAAVEPSASLAAVMALVSAAYYSSRGGAAALCAFAALAAYAIQFRPESILILPVAALIMWPRLWSEGARPSVWWAGLLFLALASVHIGHLFAIRNVDWGTNQARFSLGYVPANLAVNGWFYLSDGRFPVLFTLLAVAGLSTPAFRRERLAMAFYFLLYLGIGLAFYAGSYNYGADVRYSLMTYPPIAVLAGLGASTVIRLATRRAWPARSLLLTALAFGFLLYAPVVRATTEEAWAARADVRFARMFASGLPPNSYVLTHNPGMFQVWGYNAGQLPLIVQNPSYVRHLSDRYTGGLYVHWNFWCNVQDPAHPEFCRRALELGAVELVREYRERDQRFALYRVVTPPS
jgi:4-amino-4-deoxy-L-arabinose transferase-like glycosyltransferase